MTDLKELYQQMAEMTLPKCQECKVPFSCCSEEYCAIAEKSITEAGAVIPHQHHHPRLPYMGPNGCVVPPHLRPLCTMHTCNIASLGFERTGSTVDLEWTERYFDLRDLISLKSYERLDLLASRRDYD